MLHGQVEMGKNKGYGGKEKQEKRKRVTSFNFIIYMLL